MKIIFITGLSFFMSLVSWLNPAQHNLRKRAIPLCHATAQTAMARYVGMAADPAFQRLHANPLPFTYMGAGEMVKFSTPDGQSANGFLLKAKQTVKQMAAGLSGMVGPERQHQTTGRNVLQRPEGCKRTGG